MPPSHSAATGAGHGGLLSDARNDAARHRYPPDAVLRCEGPALFRSQAARDLACVLDLDPDVHHWRCLPLVLDIAGVPHVPDFLVIRSDRMLLMDAARAALLHPITACRKAATRLGLDYGRHEPSPSNRWRLANARDVMAYAHHAVPLRERLILLACLDEHGSLPLFACLHVLRHAPDPVASLAALVAQGTVAADLDHGLLDSTTRIRRGASTGNLPREGLS